MQSPNKLSDTESIIFQNFCLKSLLPCITFKRELHWIRSLSLADSMLVAESRGPRQRGHSLKHLYTNSCPARLDPTFISQLSAQMFVGSLCLEYSYLCPIWIGELIRSALPKGDGWLPRLQRHVSLEIQSSSSLTCPLHQHTSPISYETGGIRSSPEAYHPSFGVSYSLRIASSL